MTYKVKTPIPGFENMKEVKLEKIDDFFMQLTSCNDDTTFMLVNPFLLRDYDFEVPEYFKNLLELEESGGMLILNIMIVSTPIETSVVNFIAPLIFNTKKKLVAQILLDVNRHSEYHIMQSISDFLED